MGLREQKKQKTRKAISDLATTLFIERGYHQVTTAEIAELAEVSVPTLFKYFPTKESLVFDEDSEMENLLLNSVLNRSKNQSVFDALLDHGLNEIENLLQKGHHKQFKTFMALVDQTPELTLYSKNMWMRHEQSLAVVIRKEANTKMSKIESESIAHFILDSFNRSIATANPKSSLKTLFKILKDGWSD